MTEINREHKDRLFKKLFGEYETKKIYYHFTMLYEKYMTANKIKYYGTRRISIPTPRYIVFFNGDEENEDCIKLKLSDMYEKNSPETEYEFQWTATMLNINLGHNKKLMKSCHTLMEYSIFIDKVKRYSKIISFENAIDKAISESINENILKCFLREHRAEVKGIEQKALEDAKNLKINGISDEIIADSIGLPLETVKKMKINE